MNTRHLRSLAAGLILLGGLIAAPTAAFAAASPDQTAPPGGSGGSCTAKPSVSDSKPWYALNYSYSTIKTNSCSMKVRAVAYCTGGDTAYGPSVTKVGAQSEAQCPDEANPGIDSYTHEVYYSGSWH